LYILKIHVYGRPASHPRPRLGQWQRLKERQARRQPVERRRDFFNQSILLLQDARHGGHELRCHALGKTDEGRRLHFTFTLREDGTLIRVISARDMRRKERTIHEQADSTAAQVQDRGSERAY